MLIIGNKLYTKINTVGTYGRILKIPKSFLQDGPKFTVTKVQQVKEGNLEPTGDVQLLEVTASDGSIYLRKDQGFKPGDIVMLKAVKSNV